MGALMRCSRCGYEAVAVVYHRGPEGRWYRRGERDPVCGRHLIALQTYWQAEVQDLPPETQRAAVLRVLTGIGPSTASEVAEVIGLEGGITAGVPGTLYKLWIAESVSREKSAGVRAVWIYEVGR